MGTSESKENENISINNINVNKASAKLSDTKVPPSQLSVSFNHMFLIRIKMRFFFRA